MWAFCVAAFGGCSSPGLVSWCVAGEGKGFSPYCYAQALPPDLSCPRPRAAAEDVELEIGADEKLACHLQEMENQKLASR